MMKKTEYYKLPHLLIYNLVSTDDVTTIAKQYLHVVSKRIIYIYRINISMLQYDIFVSHGHMVLFTPE